MRINRSGSGSSGAERRAAKAASSTSSAADAVGDEPACCLDELGATAVVEGDPKVEPVAAGGGGLELGHLRAGRLRDAIPATEEPRADALGCEIGELAVDRLAQDLHQLRHLVGWSRPVLRRERVERERREAEIDGGLDGATDGPGPLPVARFDGQAVAFGPAAVAVHDDRDAPGDARVGTSWSRQRVRHVDGRRHDATLDS